LFYCCFLIPRISHIRRKALFPWSLDRCPCGNGWKSAVSLGSSVNPGPGSYELAMELQHRWRPTARLGTVQPWQRLPIVAQGMGGDWHLARQLAQGSVAVHARWPLPQLFGLRQIAPTHGFVRRGCSSLGHPGAARPYLHARGPPGSKQGSGALGDASKSANSCRITGRASPFGLQKYIDTRASITSS